MKKGFDLISLIEVALGAIAAIAVLSTWFLHPAMSGEMEKPGRLMVAFLMAGVVVATVAAVLLSRTTKRRADEPKQQGR